MNMLKVILMASVLVTPGLVSADELADSILSNGQAAMGAIQSELRASVVIAPEPVSYSVSEAIRQQGREALRRIALDIENTVYVGNTILAGQLQPVRGGTVTVGAMQVITPEVSESL